MLRHRRLLGLSALLIPLGAVIAVSNGCSSSSSTPDDAGTQTDATSGKDHDAGKEKDAGKEEKDAGKEKDAGEKKDAEETDATEEGEAGEIEEAGDATTDAKDDASDAKAKEDAADAKDDVADAKEELLADAADASDAGCGAGKTAITVLNYKAWCSLTVAGTAVAPGTPPTNTVTTVCVPSTGTVELSATNNGANFEVGTLPLPWISGTTAGGGTDDAGASFTTLASGATCVVACCPFSAASGQTAGTGCGTAPTTCN